VLRFFIAFCVIFLSIVVVVVVLVIAKGPAIVGWFVPTPSPGQMYPPAPAMPPPVSTPVEALLSQYESFLKSKAPAVFAALQPGLTDAEIDALEMKHGLKLTADLRGLYRWRNGTRPSANLDAFPNHQFVPLDVALSNRDDLRKQVSGTTPAQQQAYATYAGYRDAWVGLIVDAAGDGYFYDPARTEAQGSFFFCFAEDASYEFFPAFRNYLAAVVAGQQSGVFTASPGGVDTADFAKAQQLWEQAGAAPQR
jgi:cell wall assembly regulator SMI1